MFAEDDSYTAGLSDIGRGLGIELPNSQNPNNSREIGVALKYNAFNGEVYALNVPARPSYVRPTGLSMKVNGDNTVYITPNGATEYEIGLKPSDAAGDAPTVTGISDNGTFVFTGLAEETQYDIYLRNPATETSFASSWRKWSKSVTTYALTHVTVALNQEEYNWHPGLDDEELREHIVASYLDGTQTDFTSSDFAIEVFDENGTQVTMPFTAAGNYTMKVALAESTLKEGYVLDGKTEFSFSLAKLDLSEVTVALPDDAQTAAYTGEQVWPDTSDVIVTVDGEKYTLSEDYWEFAASDKNDTALGDAYVIVTAKSGQSTVINQCELKYTIEKTNATLEYETGCEWYEGLSLDEAALRELFTVTDDDNGQVVSSELFNITVTKDGKTVTLPITNAGAYTIALTAVKYKLDKAEFVYTVSKVPFEATVSMAGYVYGGTVSEPKLNGYAGDGAVS